MQAVQEFMARHTDPKQASDLATLSRGQRRMIDVMTQNEMHAHCAAAWRTGEHYGLIAGE
jgi:hypothetical protein